jgi:hypothetical protein
MVRECPRCGLVNPPTALRCDCGYEFGTGRVVGQPLADPTRLSDLVTRLLAGCVGTLIGVVIGVAVAVPLCLQAAAQAADTLREQGQHVCGLIIIGPLFEGVVLGTVLGGPAGLVAGLSLGWLGTRWWARGRSGRCT